MSDDNRGFHIPVIKPGIQKAILVLFLLLSFSKVYPQMDTLYVPRDIPPAEGNLNLFIKNVTDAGKLSSTIFVLEHNSRYVLTDSIHVPAGEHLKITAPEPGNSQETSPPQILCTSGPDKYSTPFKTMITCFGDITLKNIWLLYANTSGYKVSANIQIKDDPEVKANDGGEVAVFENVIFDYAGIGSDASGAVSITAKHFKGIFKNCYWKNCTDSYLRYYGRAVSFPYRTSGWHIDSLIFENCTFSNIGYVYSQEPNYNIDDGGNYSDYVKFNHCTFLNVVMFPLQSGYWNKLSVTNSIFINCHMYGNIPLQNKFHPGGVPYGGTLIIDSLQNAGFYLPFSENNRRILFTNSSYFIEKWLSDWMYNNPRSIEKRKHNRIDEIPVPQPIMNSATIKFFDSIDEFGHKIFPYFNRSALYDSTNPGFILPPSDTVKMKSFLNSRWWDSAAWSWEWKPENSFNRKWPLEENLAYLNDTLLTAGMNGFPLGDLYRWFPTEYEKWKSQKELEDERIDYWLNFGGDSLFTNIIESEESGIPADYSLSQNYPNPFNPTTQINFTVPQSGHISLKVYNLLGQEISILFEGEKPAGNHNLIFNGTGHSSGVYFYRMIGKNFNQTRKFILLR